MYSKKSNKISVIMVGAGASSLSFLNNFLYKLNENDSVELFVIDRHSDYGRGNAYKDDVISNLLNTKAGYITIDSEQKGDFYKWLSENNDWRLDFPDMEINENSYLPRALFGMYMQEKFNEVVKKFIEKDIRLIQLKGEVVNITKLEDFNYDVELNCGLKLKGNIVVLATGTNALSKNVCNLSTRIFNNPYPLKNLIKRINHESSILIVGARLSAIDTIIALKENGHKGKISIHSRSGTFPSVRGTQARYKNIYLNKEYIEANKLPINKENLFKLFDMELLNFYSQYAHASISDEYFNIKNCVVDNLENFLAKEIELAKNQRAWQAILYDTNSILSFLWNNLPEDERTEFMEKHSSFAMAMRVSIPAENAKKILQYVNEGTLEFTIGTCSVSPTYDGCECTVDNKEINFDYVIYATGSPRDISQSDSDLYGNLEKSAIIKKNKYGGIEVCPKTFNVLQESGHAHQGLFALGEVTNGTHLFNSALDIIVSHSKICSNFVVENIRNI